MNEKMQTPLSDETVGLSAIPVAPSKMQDEIGDLHSLADDLHETAEELTQVLKAVLKYGVELNTHSAPPDIPLDDYSPLANTVREVNHNLAFTLERLRKLQANLSL
jgi:hypothetical protein